MLRAMMESARREPIADSGLCGHACCRLAPAPVRTGSLTVVCWLQVGGGRSEHGHRFARGSEVLVTRSDGPHDARHLVRERDGGLVVAARTLATERPGA